MVKQGRELDDDMAIFLNQQIPAKGEVPLTQAVIVNYRN
jgi:hypothetical protein